MIEPKDLRLGNAVHVRDSSPIGEQNSFIVEITSDELSIDKDNKLPGICCFPDELIGIPLTPDALHACGFVTEQEGDDEPFYSNGSVNINWHTLQPEDAGFPIAKVKIKYLHQFQNWYRCHTGEELKINL